MLLPRLSIYRISPLLRNSPLRLTPRSKTTLQFLLKNSTSTPRPQYAAKRPIYPERLLVYHAGTGRSVFLGCLRVTTIFIFAFFCLIVAPTHFYADEPPWIAGAVMLSGAVPLVAVAYISSPYVANIHLRLPPFARHSRELLVRYSRHPAKDAKLEITTMSFMGKPRTSVVKFADLKPVRERFGMVNYARDTTEVNKTRPWWMGKAVRQFGVHSGSRVREGTGIWDILVETMEKRVGKQ